MDGSQQYPRRDADGLVDVVGLRIVLLADYLEDDDEPGGDVEELLVLVGAERFQVAQPTLAGTARVEFVLLLLGGDADFALEVGILHADEAPGLLVGAAGRGARSAHDPLDGSP